MFVVKQFHRVISVYNMFHFLGNFSCFVDKNSHVPSTESIGTMLSLPCGGENGDESLAVFSIYQSVGPLLKAVNITVQQSTIHAGKPFDALATVTFAGSPSMPLGEVLQSL